MENTNQAAAAAYMSKLAGMAEYVKNYYQSAAANGANNNEEFAKAFAAGKEKFMAAVNSMPKDEVAKMIKNFMENSGGQMEKFMSYAEKFKPKA